MPQVEVCEEELADYTSHLEKLEATPENARPRGLLADAVAAGRRVIDLYDRLVGIVDLSRRSRADYEALTQRPEAGAQTARGDSAAPARMARIRANLMRVVVDGTAAEREYTQQLREFRRLTDQIPPGFQSIHRPEGVFGPLRSDWNFAPGYHATPRSPPGTDLPETGFVRQVFDTLCPRVRILLETAVGMVNVAVNVLTVTVDPDIGALSIGGRCGQSDLTMVIEVIRAFPMVDARPTLPTSPHGDEVPGSRLIGELEFQGKWFEPQAFREVVIRAASRMDTSQPPTKMGALVSKQAVFVLFLTREEIMLSTPTEYTGLRPHPAFALAHSFNVAVEDPRLENLSIFCGSVSLSRQ